MLSESQAKRRICLAANAMGRSARAETVASERPREKQLRTGSKNSRKQITAAGVETVN